jgi:hypothetical protein
MPEICRFLLDNGHRCQAPALHNSIHCRHHDPNHPRLQPDGTLAAPPPLTRAKVSAHWRTFPASVADASAEALPDMIDDILNALADRAICHRSAGRIFAAIADRRVELEREAQQAQWRLITDRVAELARRGGANLTTNPFEALRDLPPMQLIPARGPQTKIVTR